MRDASEHMVIGAALRVLAEEPARLDDVMDVPMLFNYFARNAISGQHRRLHRGPSRWTTFPVLGSDEGKFFILPWDPDNTFGSINDLPTATSSRTTARACSPASSAITPACARGSSRSWRTGWRAFRSTPSTRRRTPSTSRSAPASPPTCSSSTRPSTSTGASATSRTSSPRATPRCRPRSRRTATRRRPRPPTARRHPCGRRRRPPRGSDAVSGAALGDGVWPRARRRRVPLTCGGGGATAAHGVRDRRRGQPRFGPRGRVRRGRRADRVRGARRAPRRLLLPAGGRGPGRVPQLPAGRRRAGAARRRRCTAPAAIPRSPASPPIESGAPMAFAVAVAPGVGYRLAIADDGAAGPYGYHLTATFTPVPDTFEPNDELAEAAAIAAGDAHRRLPVRGGVGVQHRLSRPMTTTTGCRSGGRTVTSSSRRPGRPRPAALHLRPAAPSWDAS